MPRRARQRSRRRCSLGPFGHSVAAVAAVAAAPLLLGALAFRRGVREGIRERLGFAFAAGPQPVHGAVWIHAASVGEVLAGARLSDRLRARGLATCASTVTVTGRDVMRRARPDVPCSLAPFDHPWLARTALARVRPGALVLIETELWPSWIAAASDRGVPVIVASGRISDRSFPRYRRLGPVLRGTFARLTAVAARSDEDAARFVALGVLPSRVRVCGDLKLGPPDTPPGLRPELARWLPDGPLFVAGSTHAGEEEAALGALDRALRAGIPAALVLAPRYPARAPDVVRLAAASGRPAHLGSGPAGRPLAPGEVLVLDGLGDLAAVFARATVAFVGGSLVPRGGHNLLEPAYAGRPVLFGPYTENARTAATLLLEAGAGECVPDAAALAEAVLRALADPAGASARGARGLAALEAHRGSVERTAEWIEAVLAARRDGA